MQDINNILEELASLQETVELVLPTSTGSAIIINKQIENLKTKIKSQYE